MRALLTILAGLSLAGPAAADLRADWRPDSHGLCLDTPSQPPETGPQGILAGLLDRLARVATEDDPLLANLAATGTALCIETRTTGTQGYFDTDHMLIALDWRLAPDTMLAILLHELRHLDQFARGYCPRIDIAMSENARATFAMEADAQAIATLYAWRLREAGDPGAWQALEGMQEYAPIAEAFAAAISEAGDIAAAASAAFDAWYLSPERRARYYTASCSDYLDRLDETKLLPSYDLLPEDFFVPLCALPGGGTYDCNAPDTNGAPPEGRAD